MSKLIAMTVAGSVVVCLVLLLRPVTVKIFSAKWQYRIGKTAILFFLVPVSLIVGKISFVMPQAITTSPFSETSPMAEPEAMEVTGLVDAVDSLIVEHTPVIPIKYLSFEVMQKILCIWLMGAIVFAIWHFYCYRRFMKQLQINNTPVSEEIVVLLSSCKTALDIPGEVKIMQNSKITSPMTVGILHPMIILPLSTMQKVNLKVVLVHELTHIKRKDLWVKMLVLAARTLHWFNPFAYVLCKDISGWSELSCDEELAAKMSYEERKLYGEAILNTLDMHSGSNTAFCSALSEDGKQLEMRLIMLLNAKKTKTYVSVLAAAVILVIGGVGVTFAAGAADIVDDFGAGEVFAVGATEIADDYTVPGEVEQGIGQVSLDDINIEKDITETKQVINVNIPSLNAGEWVCLGEYTLEEGDLIMYNLEAEGDGNINVTFSESGPSYASPSDDKSYTGYLMYGGNSIEERVFHFKITDKLAGTYYLWVGNYEGETLESITGTVEIAVER